MPDTLDTTITFPDKRSLGPVLGAFTTALTEQRIIGIGNGDRVLRVAEEAAELVELRHPPRAGRRRPGRSEVRRHRDPKSRS
ncbi:MAG: hypothetical protein ACRDWD_15610 [Acidimicrobiia bacterium]